MDTEIDGKRLLQEEIQKGIIRLPDDKSFANFYVCTICECQISGHMQAQSHVAGTQHNKKVKQKQKAESESAPTMKKICVTGNIDHSLNKDTTPAKEYFCHVCNVGLNGAIPMQHHLEGQTHKKKLKAVETSRALGMSINNRSESPSSGTSSVTPVGFNTRPERTNTQPVRENTTEDVTSHVSPAVETIASKSSLAIHEEMKIFFCPICEVDLNGPVQFQQHFDGKSHKKKQKSIEARKSLESTSSSRSSSRSSSPASWTPSNVQRTTVSPLSSECQFVKSLDLKHRLNLHDGNHNDDGLIIIGVDEPIPVLF